MYPIILRSRSGLPGYNLPQNLLTNPGTVFEDFETLGQWTAAGTGSIAANTTPGEFRTGTQSIKISAPDNGIESATKTINWVSGGAAPNRLRVFYYCHNAAPLNVTYLRVYLSDNTNIGSIYFKAEKVNPTIQPGWNVWDIYPATWTTTGAVNWATMIRLRIGVCSTAGATAIISMDEIKLNPVMRAAAMIVLDDIYSSLYTVGYSYMHSRNVRGSCYVISDLIDTVDRLTAAQLQEMYANGWSIGNHTKDHTNLITLSQADATTNLEACTAALDALGLTRDSLHCAYPNAGYNETVRLACIDAGILTGRKCETILYPAALAEENYFWGGIDSLDNGLTLATAETAVDLAYNTGRLAVFYGHKFAAAAGSSQWATADFEDLIDYIIAYDMPFLTINDYYQLQTSSVLVPKPT
jgi:peptidoglycan/xylan/chitin deacetylase (PgdA/CDA1 family)